MNNTLKLKDGYEITGTDGSTVYDLTIVLPNFAQIDTIRPHITDENYQGATFNDEVVENVVPVSINVNTSETAGNITVHITARDLTDIEIIKIEQELQNEALDALIMG